MYLNKEFVHQVSKKDYHATQELHLFIIKLHTEYPTHYKAAF